VRLNARIMRFDAMDLKLYDTLTREKRVFAPLDPANVRMYVCGPTVYDFAHIGNARPVIVFDVLFRLLRHIYGDDHVTYVRNITDVDDKINARAAEEYPDLPLNEAIRKVTEKTDRQFHEDVAALGCLPPTVEPRATEHIAEMRALIDRLVASNNAYVAEDNVLFSVPSMADYGRLSKRPLDEMIAGARIEVAPYKRDAMDFVLWKPSKPGEPAWPSPAGIKTPGRPGWHIECSAMSWKHLGETFDIHGGGIDLVFPHHENEIAQSRCAFQTPVMANYWMHNGFLQVEGEKMSKSEGNFVTINNLLTDQPGDVVRLQMLMTHYRQPINWTNDQSLEASRIVEDLFKGSLGSIPKNTRAEPTQELVEILSDDLNTPAAIGYLHRLSKSAHKNDEDSQSLMDSLVFLGVFRDFEDEVLPLIRRGGLLADAEGDFGLLNAINSSDWVRRQGVGLGIEAAKRVYENRDVYLRYLAPGQSWSAVAARNDVEAINRAIERRLAARKAKDFTKSDRIRDELAAMGVVLKDTKDGTTWEIAR
jgi:cysteinyl-tRNA synthetase